MSEPEEVRLRVSGDPDIVEARMLGRRLAEAAGFSATDLTLIATAISEITRNITSYAGTGEIVMRVVHGNGRLGLEVVATDQGPGIPDVARALSDGYSTGRGMGLGLPGARRLMDEFLIESTVGVGTTVTMRKWGAYRVG
jgi:serine/threonine-protein kinase RsbT